MSVFDVEPEDMTNPTFIDDRLNALLTNGAPSDADGTTRELALLVQQIQGNHPAVEVPPDLEDRHVTAIMGAVAERRSLTMVPAERTLTFGPQRARAAAMTWSRKLAAATLSLSTLFGGMAYAGMLPDGLQRAAAKIADRVGIDLPGRADVAGADDSTDAPEVGPGSQTAREPGLHLDDTGEQPRDAGSTSRSGGGVAGGRSAKEESATGSHDNDGDEDEPRSREGEDDDAAMDDVEDPAREQEDSDDDNGSSDRSGEDRSGGEADEDSDAEGPAETGDEDTSGGDEEDDGSDLLDDAEDGGDSSGQDEGLETE